MFGGRRAPPNHHRSHQAAARQTTRQAPAGLGAPLVQLPRVSQRDTCVATRAAPEERRPAICVNIQTPRIVPSRPRSWSRLLAPVKLQLFCLRARRCRRGRPDQAPPTSSGRAVRCCCRLRRGRRHCLCFVRFPRDSVGDFSRAGHLKWRLVRQPAGPSM